jgi:alkylation response protein AidB-like acyl-CoA dehydrogenase
MMCCRAILGRGARATVDKAMDLAGGGSFLRRNPLERLFRDVQGVPLPSAAGKAPERARWPLSPGLPLDD